MKCPICPRGCEIEEGQRGFCLGRLNKGGKVVSENYGKLTSITLDPIEKKPFARFMPGSMILSVGSYGCNLRCPFCQNFTISTSKGHDIDTIETSPEELAKRALSMQNLGNIGIAYTYNEPLISYEFVMDSAKIARKLNMKNVLVTNGYICERPLSQLLPYIDAMNIDLKGFTEEFYRKLGGDLAAVKRTISIAARKCHVEVTCLVIPGENDSPIEIEKMSEWLAIVSSDIPLHISRFFPRYKYSNMKATPIETVYSLADAARRHLKFVYTGNC